jgi:SAM-dependent methyltransferase
VALSHRASVSAVKNALLRLLGRAGLLASAYRMYERLRAARLPRPPEPGAADGLPVPPPRLIVRVAGTPDTAWFLESGRLAAESIRAALVRAGTPIEGVGSILDFGCGCGRVIRNWARLDARIAGSDLSGEAIDWCRAKLPFARFATNGLSPPLAFGDSSFGLAYALSVLTHLPAAIQHEWMDELARVLAPGGLLLVTTHGERYLDRLDESERQRFLAGELVVRWPEVPGTNLCTAFHPPSWVRDRLLPHGFEEVEFVPEGAAGNPYQDLFVLRRAA